MPNPIPVRLKAARLKANLSQKTLGVMIGIDENSASSRMNHYEKGRHIPDPSTLSRIADVLAVPLPYFFCQEDITAQLVQQIDKLTESKKIALLERLNDPKSEFNQLG